MPNKCAILHVIAFIAVSTGGPRCDAQNAGTITVSATADLWRAGGFVLPVNPGNFGIGDVPAEVKFVAGADDSITISASGSWNCGLGFGGPGGSPCGPFPNVNVIGVGGISGIEIAAHTLSGVFLDDTNPPDVVACNGIGKVFPIGNGGTFKIPPTATRLVLGLPDECSGGASSGGTPGCYGDNSGAVTAAFTLIPSSSSSSSNSKSSSRVTLVDPVPDLLSPTGATVSDAAALDNPLQGREVKGVAADGVAQVVVRIPACQADDTMTVSVLNEVRIPFGSIDDNGGVAIPGTSDLSAFKSEARGIPTTILNEHPVGFVIYRAPIDFVRPGDTDDVGKAVRSVFLQIKLSSIPDHPIIQEVKILRPLVVLIHGTFSSPAVWDTFTSVINSPLFATSRLDFSQDITSQVTETIPHFSRVHLKLHPVRRNVIGVRYNAPFLLTQMMREMELFRDGVNNPMHISIAAIQADIVAHSLGGLMARGMARVGSSYPGPNFFGVKSFGQGYIHKIITLGTPHLGTNLSLRIIDGTNECVRNSQADFSEYAFDSVRIGDSEFEGAVADQVGDGTGAKRSPTLLSLQVPVAGEGGGLPSALIAGEFDIRNDSADISSQGFFVKKKCGTILFLGQEVRRGDFLADNYGFAEWPQIFNDAPSDVIVPVNSAINGELEGDKVLTGVVHGPGTVGTGGVSDPHIGFHGPHLLEEGGGARKALELLNTNVNDTLTFVRLP